MAILGLRPEGRICRFYSTFGLVLLQIHKFLRLPMWMMPVRRLRQVEKFWSQEMQNEYIWSAATKLPHDEPCRLSFPIDYAPKAEVAPQNRLTKRDIADFYENGFLEPFSVFDPQEIRELGDKLLEQRELPSATYGNINDRDRHLEVPEMLDAMKHPAITERLAQLLGPNLIAWRSQIFHKPPGGATIGWHQASTYFFEMGFTDPTLIPPRLDELFMLTVWIPCDPVTFKNGCLQFVRGSLKGGIKNMRLGGDIGFHEDRVKFYPDYEIDLRDVANVEMDPGQVLIFSERTIHGSPPNNTDRNRFAFNYRVTPTDVKIYPDSGSDRGHKRFHKATQMAETYDLERWNAVLLRGEADGTLNRTV